jgi:hypothetical protein
MPAKQGPKRGDWTGQQRARQQKENAETLRQREKELTMHQQVDAALDEDAVYDPKTGQPISGTERAEQLQAEGLQEIRSEEPKDLTQDPRNKAAKRSDRQANPVDENLGKGEGIEKQGAEVAEGQVGTLVQAPPEEIERQVVVRAKEDIEDMTVGVGTHYSMEAGRRYVVPQHVAEHMETKDLVWH